METYQLGLKGDRIVTVNKFADGHIVTIIEKGSYTKCIQLPPKRWAEFRHAVTDADNSLKAALSGDQNIKLQKHIGGGHYISVTSGYQCVDLRKWFQPRDSNDGKIKPTKTGVALRLDEWSDLIALVETINITYPSLGSAQPCYCDDDHMNQEGWLNCKECHPFPKDNVA